MTGRTAPWPAATGEGVVLRLVNENIGVIMPVPFLTQKKTSVELSLVKIVFIGHLQNRVTGSVSGRTLVHVTTRVGTVSPGPAPRDTANK